MAYALTTYEQTGIYDPTNPNQRIREGYASSPGTWASYYWNPVKSDAQMRGPGLGMTWASLPSTAQLAIVLAIGGAVGYFGFKKFGSSLRPTLKKLPIVGNAFAGLGRSRRRR